MKQRNIQLLTLISLMVFPSFLFSQPPSLVEWNQFRGVNRNGINNYQIKQDTLFEGSYKMLWKKDIGAAFSEIVVAGENAYTMLSEKRDSLAGFEYVAAYDSNTGNELWKTMVDSIFIDVDGWGDGPRSTPAVDEKHLYCLSGKGKLTALDKNTGKIIWKRDFVNEFGSTRPRWGYSTSPMLLNDLVLIEAGGTDSNTFVAFNKNSGEIKWAKGSGVAQYNSPTITEIDGTKQIIFANGPKIYSFNLNGDTLWTYNSPVASPTGMPVVIENNKIFISAIRNIGFVIIEIQNNIPKEIVRGADLKTDFSSCVYYNGYVYGFNVAALQCISAETGKKTWTKRGFGKGSLILVGDKLLVLSDKGKIIQVKADGDKYIEQGSFQAIEGKSWTAPSFANGRLYIRNLTEMACFVL